MNTIGRGNRVGFILSGTGGMEPAAFRDVLKRNRWAVEVGKTDDRALFGIGYDLNGNITADAGIAVDGSLETDLYAGMSYRW